MGEPVRSGAWQADDAHDPVFRGLAGAAMSDSEDGGGTPRAEPAESPLILGKLLDHLEKTLADSYRKEIDQEENVWRSLPFFAATLALQMAAIVGLVEKLPSRDGGSFWWIAVPLGVVAFDTCHPAVHGGGDCPRQVPLHRP
jgi:hypothetical protein